jgi:adenine-specific DNA-methyltransferase
LWSWQEVGSTRHSKQELSKILSHEDDPELFTTPKPVSLLDRILRIGSDPGSLVLDFFAGSGTTAHAVHKLNKEDGGNRRVILVSSDESTEEEPNKNLCRDVCAARVRRVIEGYNDTPGLGGDFAYLRTRRIAPGMLTDIEHAQVWTALQLTHMPTLTGFDDSKPFVVADHEDQRLIYIPHMLAKDTRALTKAVADSPAAILYTWQPELASKRLEAAANLQIEPVPESLARRFGIRI